MSNKKTWFITGAGRGMGLDFAKAVLEAGNAVVDLSTPLDFDEAGSSPAK